VATLPAVLVVALFPGAFALALFSAMEHPLLWSHGRSEPMKNMVIGDRAVVVLVYR
jgi:hypothetical protein